MSITGADQSFSRTVLQSATKQYWCVCVQWTLSTIGWPAFWRESLLTSGCSALCSGHQGCLLSHRSPEFGKLTALDIGPRSMSSCTALDISPSTEMAGQLHYNKTTQSFTTHVPRVYASSIKYKFANNFCKLPHPLTEKSIISLKLSSPGSRHKLQQSRQIDKHLTPLAPWYSLVQPGTLVHWYNRHHRPVPSPPSPPC